MPKQVVHLRSSSSESSDGGSILSEEEEEELPSSPSVSGSLGGTDSTISSESEEVSYSARTSDSDVQEEILAAANQSSSYEEEEFSGEESESSSYASVSSSSRSATEEEPKHHKKEKKRTDRHQHHSHKQPQKEEKAPKKSKKKKAQATDLSRMAVTLATLLGEAELELELKRHTLTEVSSEILSQNRTLFETVFEKAKTLKSSATRIVRPNKTSVFGNTFRCVRSGKTLISVIRCKDEDAAEEGALTYVQLPLEYTKPNIVTTLFNEHAPQEKKDAVALPKCKDRHMSRVNWLWQARKINTSVPVELHTQVPVICIEKQEPQPVLLAMIQAATIRRYDLIAAESEGHVKSSEVKALINIRESIKELVESFITSSMKKVVPTAKGGEPTVAPAQKSKHASADKKQPTREKEKRSSNTEKNGKKSHSKHEALPKEKHKSKRDDHHNHHKREEPPKHQKHKPAVVVVVKEDKKKRKRSEVKAPEAKKVRHESRVEEVVHESRKEPVKLAAPVKETTQARDARVTSVLDAINAQNDATTKQYLHSIADFYKEKHQLTECAKEKLLYEQRLAK